MLSQSQRSTLIAVFSVVVIGGSTQAQLPSRYRIPSSSGTAELNLVKHLKQRGVQLYVNSAIECMPIDEQLALFGRQAAEQLDVIDCADKDQEKHCENLAIATTNFGFPSWKIDGKLYSGRISLEELSNLVDYRGDRTFKNPPSKQYREFDRRSIPPIKMLQNTQSDAPLFSTLNAPLFPNVDNSEEF